MHSFHYSFIHSLIYPSLHSFRNFFVHSFQTNEVHPCLPRAPTASILSFWSLAPSLLLVSSSFSGTIWHDLSGHELTWHVTWDDMTWRDMILHDMTWRNMTWSDMTWRDMTWHELAWHIMTWHVIWDDMRWDDMIWHDRTWPGIKHDMKRHGPPALTDIFLICTPICHFSTITNYHARQGSETAAMGPLENDWSGPPQQTQPTS